MASCDYAGAKESFTQVLTSWPDEHFPVAAWAGRSVSWSRLGDAVAARGDLLEAIKSYTPSRAIGAVSLAMLAQVAIDEHDAAALRHDLPAAAAWITVVMDLDVPDHLQLAIIERFAGTHQALAEGVGSGQIVLDDATSASTLAMQAGDVFLRAAQYHAATPGASSKGMLSLHQAAICYNTAGRQDLAIDACQEYVATTSVEDPTRVEVLRLLGTAHEAQLEYEAAADAYLEAIETHPRSLSASASRVPLARVLLALDRPGEAQSVLLHVLDGRDELLTPEAADYREAVIALGHLYWSQERFIPAIERLTEAINRYGDDPRAATLRFQLAGAYRGAAAALGSAAATATTPSEVDAIAAVEHDHLQDAAEGFARVVEIYQEWTGQPLTIIQDDQYRQALLWYADCLFEMEQYAPAATAYDDAARTFHDHASSVYALVQVVNACSAMGDQEQAQAAHRRALVRLDELPNVAFEGPDAVMARNAWDQWMLNAPVAAVETQ
jgi:tetratricopeptide (TPR) repeat protein